MSAWVPTAFGALDIRTHEFGEQGFELMLVPALPGTPVFLLGDGAELWLRLLDGPLDDADLDARELEILRSFALDGLASVDGESASRVYRVNPPWLESPIHELVYALLGNVAGSLGIDIVFIKGPTLRAQGLREKAHSGDVDCWVLPGEEWRLAEAMKAWGWVPILSAFAGTAVAHSLTLKAESWGCEIDVHTRFPGISIPPKEAFHIVHSGSEAREFAGVSGRTPVLDVHAVILALHELRPVAGAKPSSTKVSNAVDTLRTAGASTVALADVLGAGYVLRDALTEVFPHQVSLLHTLDQPREWDWRLSDSTHHGLLRALSSLPVRQRPMVLWRLLFPNREVLVASGWLADSQMRPYIAYFRRLLSATRSLCNKSAR